MESGEEYYALDRMAEAKLAGAPSNAAGGSTRQERQTALWHAIHRYAIACGADPDRMIYGNTKRQEAVRDIESIVFGE